LVLPGGLMVASNNMEQSVVEDLKVRLAEIARILKKKFTGSERDLVFFLLR